MREPGGRGFSASDAILFTIRWRSALAGIVSSSLRADFLIRMLYLATLFQILHHILEQEIRLSSSLLEGRQILRILS